MLMQKAVNMMGVLLTALLLIGALIYGCGTEDVLEENNLRYQTNVSFSDADEEGTLAVDVFQDPDCDNDANTTDPEPFTDLYAIISISIEDEDTPGLEMTGYDISFQPLRSYDAANNPITPPSVGSYSGAYNVMIPPASEVTFSIPCMETDLKGYIGSFLSGIDGVFLYRIDIRMDFVDEYDEDRELSVDKTLNFGSYNNCD
jgi:hypothetical protein